MKDNPARKGPTKVWSGYRILRVPNEIFYDVKEFMEKRKHEFLTGETIEISHKNEPNQLEKEMDVLKSKIEILEAQISQIKNIGENRITTAKKYESPSQLTSKERIKMLLQSRPGERLSTIEIARELGMPNPTCRQAARELAESDPRVHQISGRPNKYYYN